MDEPRRPAPPEPAQDSMEPHTAAPDALRTPPSFEQAPVTPEPETPAMTDVHKPTLPPRLAAPVRRTTVYEPESAAPRATPAPTDEPPAPETPAPHASATPATHAPAPEASATPAPHAPSIPAARDTAIPATNDHANAPEPQPPQGTATATATESKDVAPPDARPAGPQPAAAPEPPRFEHPRPREKKTISKGRLLAIRIAAFGTPVLLLLAVLLSHRYFIGAYIRFRASKLGVSVSFDDFDRGKDRLTLKGARMSLAGVDGIKVSAASVKLSLRGERVTSIDATDVVVDVEGSATDRVLEIAAWSGENPDTYRLAGSASPIRVAWRVSDEDAPWLTATGGSFTSDGKTARLSAAASNVGGVPLGKVGAGFTVDGSVVTVELGKTANAEAPITARVTAKPKPPRVDVTLRPVKLESLSAALGLSLPAPGATASGHAELVLGKRGSAEAISGSAELKLDGYLPPHPREMSGILAGKKTSVTTKLSVAADRSKVTLSDVVARAGKLELKGSGVVARVKNYATLNMELKGPVACSDLVRSSAKDKLGLFGEILGEAASGAVGGSVAVTVTVEADSRDLRAAKVKHKAAVGCGIKMPF